MAEKKKIQSHLIRISTELKEFLKTHLQYGDTYDSLLKKLLTVDSTISKHSQQAKGESKQVKVKVKANGIKKKDAGDQDQSS